MSVIPLIVRRLSAVVLLLMLISCKSGGGSDGSLPGLDTPEVDNVDLDNPLLPTGGERPVDEATAPNNSKILTGDPIGTGSFAAMDLHRQLPFEIIDLDDPEALRGDPREGLFLPVEPGLEMVTVYLLRTRANKGGTRRLVGIIKNTSSFIRCDINIPYGQLLNANGDDVREPFLADALPEFTTGPVRKAFTGALVSQCLDPGETAYFGTKSLGFDEPNEVASVRLGFSETAYASWLAPPESVMPISYQAILEGVEFADTRVLLTVRNVGPVTVRFRAATLIALDDNGIPLVVLRNERDLESSGEPRLLKPEEDMVVEFTTEFQGLSTRVHASVDFDDCGDACDE